jgi:hypothetical protein
VYSHHHIGVDHHPGTSATPHLTRPSH